MHYKKSSEKQTQGEIHIEIAKVDDKEKSTKKKKDHEKMVDASEKVKQEISEPQVKVKVQVKSEPETETAKPK